MEDEEETEEAEESVGGGGEFWSDDETLPLLVRLWRLEEALEPTARGIWLGWGCSTLLSPPDKVSDPPGLWVKDSTEEDTASGCLGFGAELGPGCERWES